MTLLDLSADLGLIAAGCITLNICIGLLIAVRYSPVRYWPHKRFDIFWMHRWTGYPAMIFVLAHPLVLLWVREQRFRVVDIAAPVRSPLQPVWNTVGASAVYLLLIVIISSALRKQFGRKLWRKLHWLNYAAAGALFLHGIFADPQLKTGRVDFLDGEKVFLELCLISIIVFSFFRWRVHVRKDRVERERHVGRYAHLA